MRLEDEDFYHGIVALDLIPFKGHDIRILEQYIWVD